jgi:DNA-binding MarR family transcriptional regulator
MAVASTSKKAYNNLKDLGDKQYQVHQAIGELGTPSNQDIADKLGWEINRVTGRVNELSKYGFVEVSGLKLGRFGNMVKTWRAVNPADNKIKEQIYDCAD